MGLFQVLAAVLHLGNVEIKDKDSDSSLIPVSTILLLNHTLHIYIFGRVFIYLFIQDKMFSSSDFS